MAAGVNVEGSSHLSHEPCRQVVERFCHVRVLRAQYTFLYGQRPRLGFLSQGEPSLRNRRQQRLGAGERSTIVKKQPPPEAIQSCHPHQTKYVHFAEVCFAIAF